MDLSNLSDAELIKLKKKLEIEVSVFDACQQAVKVNLNSAFGTMSSPSCMWFVREIGEAITVTGQFANRSAMRCLNEYLDKVTGEVKDRVIGGDTDSIFVSVDDVVDKFYAGKTTAETVEFVDQMCKRKFAPQLNECMAKVCQQTNAYRQAVNFKREIIAEKAIFFAAKKRYVMYVWDKEGKRHKEAKLKITGLAIVRSETPTAAREKLKGVLTTIFTKDEKFLQADIAAFKKEWKTMPLNMICSAKGTKSMVDCYDDQTDRYREGKTVPMQVRAAVTHNRMITKKNLSAQYSMIRSGDKIRYVYLKTPNACGQNVIGWIKDLPEQFDLGKYVDVDTQFEKGFMSPLNSILNAIGWHAEEQNTLDDLFG